MREFRVREGRARLPPGHRRPPDEPLRLRHPHLPQPPPKAQAPCDFNAIFSVFLSDLHLNLTKHIKINISLNVNRKLHRILNLDLNLNLNLHRTPSLHS